MRDTDVEAFEKNGYNPDCHFMPEIPDSLAPESEQQKTSADLIQWHTVTYRTVGMWAGIVLVLISLTLAIFFPEVFARVIDAIRGARGSSAADIGSARIARFTNLEGSVRIRKAGGVEWGTANVSMDLEQGDTVQTAGDGLARIAFADGTLYVVKPDSLIVLEQTGTQSASAPNVAVQVSSGIVDLSTPLATESRVLIADAEARIHRQSRASVTNNPQTNTHQITVSKGAASVRRGAENVELAQYEQVSFAGPGSRMVKSKFVGPPILLSPANLAPVVMSGNQAAEVDFTWNAVPSAELYRLRISTSPVFTTTVYDRRLQSTSVRVTDLKEGTYYWTVTSLRSGQKESDPSEPSQFTVTRDGRGEILLAVDRVIQHGRVLEIIGRTEPGATVLVNNETVFSVAPDGKFKHFTNPLPNSGASLVTITAQNSKGKVATLRKTVTIQ